MPYSHSELKEALESAQAIEEENREMAEEADSFVNVRGGMWEAHIWEQWDLRPRYTIDQVNPVIDGVVGEIEASYFGIKVSPMGEGATVETAKAYGGYIRGVEAKSSAAMIYKAAGRESVTTGIAGWRVVQRERFGNPFMQDLCIEELSNFKSRVWFNEGCIKRDASDAELCFVLDSVPYKLYEKEYPKATKTSFCDMRSYYNFNSGYENSVVIAEIYERRHVKTTYVLFNNGKVYKKTEDLMMVLDELKKDGIEIVDEKDVYEPVYYHGIANGDDYIVGSEETSFRMNPVIPVYANYRVKDNGILYYGIVEKLMDPQRILNYSESKKVAESSLKPIEKVWMTSDQASTDRVVETLATANVNADPHQVYDYAEGQPQPFKMAPTPMDQVLIEVAASNKQYIRDTANFNDAVRGVGLSGQSGETVDKLQFKGNISNIKYFNALEVAIARTGQVIADTFHRVYDEPQEVASVEIDGTVTTVSLYDTMVDEQTGQTVILNDVSIGTHSVVCSAGPSFKNMQEKAARNMLEAAAFVPEILQRGADVFVRSLNSPMLDLVAERVRVALIEAGSIPYSQLTEKEKEAVKKVQEEKAKQPLGPLEQAQLGIAQAEMKKADASAQEVQSKADDRRAKAAIELKKLMVQFKIDQAKLAQERDKKMLDAIQAQSDILKKSVDSLLALKQTVGADQLLSPELVKAVTAQVMVVLEQQKNLQ